MQLKYKKILNSSYLLCIMPNLEKIKLTIEILNISQAKRLLYKDILEASIPENMSMTFLPENNSFTYYKIKMKHFYKI